jgi:hypothetical protein
VLFKSLTEPEIVVDASVVVGSDGRPLGRVNIDDLLDAFVLEASPKPSVPRPR